MDIRFDLVEGVKQPSYTFVSDQEFSLPLGRDDSFPETPLFKSLIFSDQLLGDAKALDVFRQLQHDGHYEHLILSHTGVSDFAMAGLADLLKVNHFIGWLVLNKNELGRLGMEALAVGLSDNKGLKHLVLADNEIDDEGVVALVDGLKGHPSIRSVFLQGNGFGDKGVLALIALMKDTPSLSRLDIRDVGFVSEKVRRLFRTTADENGVVVLT